jgi:nucleoside phosphorylase
MIVALPEEYDVVKGEFPSIGDKSTDSHVRLMHDLGVPGYTLTSILSEEMGSENALISTISAMDDLCPDLVICIGIAGGLLKDASLGDVCVSNEIIDILHNSKVVDAGAATDTEVSPSFYNIDPEIIATCRFLRSHPNLEPKLVAWKRECDARKQLISKDKGDQKLPGFDADKSTNFHVGTIICGPVSASQNLNKKLKTLNRKVLAIETESGGMATSNNTDFRLI